MIDINAIANMLTEICDHYEFTAPTVRDWADGLYRRIDSNPETVLLPELLAVTRFKECGEWEQPNYAANRIYKMCERIGREVSYQIGF